jgi:hypothetical protein
MECFLSFAFLMVVFVGAIVFCATAQSQSDQWNSTYRQLARRYGGSCLPAGWFGKPKLRFRYGPTHVLINSVSSGSTQYTQVLISWPDHHLSMEVVSGQSSSQHVTLRTAKIYSGSTPFDVEYDILGSNASDARLFLSDGVRWQIDRLRLMGVDEEIYVSVSHGRIAIVKPKMIRRLEDLDEFVQLGLDLYDQAMLTRSVGIEFVDGPSAKLITEAICQVCGEDIVSEMVFCQRCKTPHHRDCWQYYGACSTYGCQETTFVTPQIARPLNEPPPQRRPAKPR